MRIIEEEQLDFNDLLIMPKAADEHKALCSRSQVNLEREFKWYDASNTKKMTMSCIPLGTSNMGTVGTCKMAELMVLSNHLACLEKHISFGDIENLFIKLRDRALSEGKDSNFYYNKVVLSIGVKEDPEKLIEFINKWKQAFVMVDVPNGYMYTLLDRVSLIHKRCPDAFIIAGNVVTSDGAKDIIRAGAKCVKSGIGNGSCCRTRVKTGVGRPQASTLIEIADAVHQCGCYCLCDGGVTNAGDVCKAFGCGADFVISGSLFAGCAEADGDVIEKDGKKFKQYYGMSSHLAQEKHFGGVRKYSASEGIEKLIPYTGTLDDALQDIDGGLKSCCTYIGCVKMKNFSRHTTFYKVHKQFNDIYEKCDNIKSC